MAANTAPTRLWPMVESDAAYFSGCPPCGRARFRLDMAVHSSRYAQRSRMTPSRGGPSQKVIPYEASARTSRSIWTKLVLSRCRVSRYIGEISYAKLIAPLYIDSCGALAKIARLLRIRNRDIQTHKTWGKASNLA